MIQQLGRWMFLLGVVLAGVGLAVWGAGKIGFRGLSGDMRYESDRVSFYFPIVTCLVLSLVLSLLVWLWQGLRK